MRSVADERRPQGSWGTISLYMLPSEYHLTFYWVSAANLSLFYTLVSKLNGLSFPGYKPIGQERYTSAFFIQLITIRVIILEFKLRLSPGGSFYYFIQLANIFPPISFYECIFLSLLWMKSYE